MTLVERWEGPGNAMVKGLHAALVKQEEHVLSTNSNTNRSGSSLVPKPQLLRAVELEELLVKKVNAWIGEKKTHDFSANPVHMHQYTTVGGRLIAAIEATPDESAKAFWTKDAGSPMAAKALFEHFFDASWFTIPQAAPDGKASVPSSPIGEKKKHKKEKKHKKDKKAKKAKKHDDGHFHPYNPIGHVTQMLHQMDNA
ncbi:hypothetical protein SPRG_03969 [Saprolegnia parasitica CBS 223.65]|uniref:Uncharacterized protein n=1 Tax=Saprolegnia parasitica (strain CBS 223.65) TaxID=695850 RepID=A0A067CX23_SAPPC|nr:hypothetical protein SPRG_03969 [Saprolegnia parasitica CBS 223.65]KDO31352.1 hypothetical protein SPRG_03969 [Saprolegnia parasitica CBS 223.65]|eukprot:XP_012197951.1 hypothetical protein SPRG_03969 [Saprolegnia parasitica CBS 223.65]